MSREQRIGTLIFLLLCVACLTAALLRNQRAEPPVNTEAEAALNRRLESLRLPAERPTRSDSTARKPPRSPKGAPGRSPRKQRTPSQQAPGPTRSPLDEVL